MLLVLYFISIYWERYIVHIFKFTTNISTNEQKYFFTIIYYKTTFRSKNKKGCYKEITFEKTSEKKISIKNKKLF